MAGRNAAAVSPGEGAGGAERVARARMVGRAHGARARGREGSSMKRLLVTGSSGLIGSEVCAYFAQHLGWFVHGADNNGRALFFGPQGDTRWNQRRLEA